MSDLLDAGRYENRNKNCPLRSKQTWRIALTVFVVGDVVRQAAFPIRSQTLCEPTRVLDRLNTNAPSATSSCYASALWENTNEKNSPIPKSKSPIAKFGGNLPPGFSCLVQSPVHSSTVGSRAFWLLALRYGCLPPQLSATGGYVGTVPGDLSHSTKRRSWVTLSLTLGWSDIRVYTLFIVDLEGLKYLGHSKNSWLIDWNWSIEPLMAVFPNFFDLLPKIAPRRGSLPPITHEQQYFFSQKCPLFFGCTPN